MGQPSDTPTDPKRFIAVAGHTRLFRRGAIYYFRAKVPDKLRPILGKGEIRYSLKTADFQTAKKLCNVASVKADGELNAAIAKFAHALPPEPPEPLTDAELYQQVAMWFVEQERKADTWAAVEVPACTDTDRETARENLAGEVTEYATALNNPNGARQTEQLTDAFINASPALGVSKGSNDYFRLSALLRRAMVEILNRKLDRLEGGILKPTDPAFVGLFAHSTPPEPKKQSITLKALCERFMDYQHKTHSDTTPVTYSIPVKALREVLGDSKRIAEITGDDVRLIGETFQRMPAHISQRYPGLPLLKAIAKADKDGNENRQSVQTVSKYFNNVCAIFNFAVEEGLLDVSPAKGKKLRERFRVKVRAKRELFKLDELQAIFHAPIYTGCIDDENNYTKPGPNHPRRARFWVPLLGLFQGARLNEICQFYCEDVKEKDGVHFLSIRTDLDDEESTDKRLKTLSSERDVPLHPELIKMGFLDFVNSRRGDGEQRLFSELKLGKSSNRYSSIVSRWFASFVTTACGTKPKAVFHSLRHHFRTALSQAGVGIELADELCGWADERRGMEKRYNHLNIKQLAEAVSKVRYDGLDLSHLYTVRQ